MAGDIRTYAPPTTLEKNGFFSAIQDNLQTLAEGTDLFLSFNKIKRSSLLAAFIYLTFLLKRLLRLSKVVIRQTNYTGANRGNDFEFCTMQVYDVQSDLLPGFQCWRVFALFIDEGCVKDKGCVKDQDLCDRAVRRALTWQNRRERTNYDFATIVIAKTGTWADGVEVRIAGNMPEGASIRIDFSMLVGPQRNGKGLWNSDYDINDSLWARALHPETFASRKNRVDYAARSLLSGSKRDVDIAAMTGISWRDVQNIFSDLEADGLWKVEKTKDIVAGHKIHRIVEGEAGTLSRMLSAGRNPWYGHSFGRGLIESLSAAMLDLLLAVVMRQIPGAVSEFGWIPFAIGCIALFVCVLQFGKTVRIRWRYKHFGGK